jgi:hypothetical protein
MIFDNQSLFSDAQAVAAASVPSANQIDFGAPGTPFGGRVLVPDHGKCVKIPMFLFVNAAFNNLTSLTIALRVSATANMASPKVVLSATFPLAELTAGQELRFPEELPEGMDLRYADLLYTATGTVPTTGSITAGVVAARQTNFARHY